MSFYNKVKSTIDKIGTGVAAQLRGLHQGMTIEAVNLDATTGVEEILSSSNPAVVWQLVSLTEAPVDPLYDLMFLMGIKTTSDVSNQLMSSLISVVQETLPCREVLEIKDYSGVEAPTQIAGRMIITRSGVEEQEFDKSSGMRMIGVYAKADRVF